MLSRQPLKFQPRLIQFCLAFFGELLKAIVLRFVAAILSRVKDGERIEQCFSSVPIVFEQPSSVFAQDGRPVRSWHLRKARKAPKLYGRSRTLK